MADAQSKGAAGFWTVAPLTREELDALDEVHSPVVSKVPDLTLPLTLTPHPLLTFLVSFGTPFPSGLQIPAKHQQRIWCRSQFKTTTKASEISKHVSTRRV
jgi:hypothetical protein